jgi:phenylalanyl-tRNA synthetase beta chain
LPTDNNQILTEVSKKGFEVEGFEYTVDGDALFEIKVLPNRIADAFSVRGMAREFSAVFGLKWGGKIQTPNLSDFILNNDHLILQNEKTELPLYIFTGVKVTGFDNTKETPEWIKDIIVKSGGRSINCLVDITNLMLFSFGQPAHVFDFEKMTGKVVTRFAKDGEELELLDGKKVKLSQNDFVIADESKALSLAGIKGGKFAETTKDTKVCLFEMANFNPTMIRKTSQTLGIRTDASKIFENGITTNKTEDALGLLLATIKELDPNAKVDFIINKKWQDKSPIEVETSVKEISDYAGKELSEKKVLEYLSAQNFQVKKAEDKLLVTGSSERLDINISEDICEEVIRLYGFDNLESKPLSLSLNQNHSKYFLLENFLRAKLFEKGYTEIFNYVFVSGGDVKVKAGLAEDKMYLRKNLSEGMKNSFVKNYNYLPIVESGEVKTFEFGTIFKEEGEFKNACITWDDNKKKSKYLPQIEEDIKNILKEIGVLDFSVETKEEKPALLEFSLDKILEKVITDNLTIPFIRIEKDLQSINYKPISIYPFIVRDIAVWLPNEEVSFESIKENILKLNLLNFEKTYLFDKFTKKFEDDSEKTSIAFRIIFQSYNETLTDEVVEKEMLKVSEYLKGNNFEVR